MAAQSGMPWPTRVGCGWSPIVTCVVSEDDSAERSIHMYLPPATYKANDHAHSAQRGRKKEGVP
jgi:hypothetical protein